MIEELVRIYAEEVIKLKNLKDEQRAINGKLADQMGRTDDAWNNITEFVNKKIEETTGKPHENLH